MRLKALVRGEAKYRAVLDPVSGEKIYINAKVLPDQEFEYRGDTDHPPNWCVPIDDDAKVAYELAFGTSDPDKIPRARLFRPDLNNIPHPSMRGKVGHGQKRGAGTGVAGMDGDGGSPVMPY